MFQESPEESSDKNPPFKFIISQLILAFFKREGLFFSIKSGFFRLNQLNRLFMSLCCFDLKIHGFFSTKAQLAYCRQLSYHQALKQDQYISNIKMFKKLKERL